MRIQTPTNVLFVFFRCSVCLGDYQSDERLQKIPSCGHTFHVDCIDHWLATHTTCPLCRLSLLPATKPPVDQPDHVGEASEGQVHEQSAGILTAVRTGHLENEALESERGCRTSDNPNNAGRDGEIPSHGEGSDVLNVKSHGNAVTTGHPENEAQESERGCRTSNDLNSASRGGEIQSYGEASAVLNVETNS